MNAQPHNIAANKQNTNQPVANQEIDLMALFGALIDRKYFIIAVTTLFMLVGIMIAVFSPPVYQATSMIQVEETGGSVPGLDDMAGMFESTSAAITEIELLKSRSVIGEAVDSLKLDIVAEPKLFPFIGGRAFRKFNPTQANALAAPSFGASSYAWGGEKISVFRFDVPNYAIGSEYILVALANNQLALQNPNGETVLTGQVGQELSNGIIHLTVRELNARAGTEFTLMRRNRLNTVLDLQAAIGANEKGKDSGIINLSLQSADANYAEKVLNKVAAIYVQRNVKRNSAEAQKSLEFLEVQLPEIKQQLESAEARFNDYQIKRQSINITLETQGVLEQVVKLETQLQELELKRLEMSRKFKKNHPTYQGLLEQVATVKQQRNTLVAEVGKLPKTQQELLRLKRDIEVSNQIYMLLLGKTQELDIVRAGTVGNVRVIDFAEVNRSKPVKPKKALIVVMATLLGGMLAVAIVLVQKAMHKGVEDPAEIEAIGLPVYASVPYSDYQDKLSGFSKLSKVSKTGKAAKANKAKSILALDNPADLSIEALRSLRTSLHFAMMEAKNNVIAISGPSPGVGKSFISVNLAAVLAQSDKKVLIVDADMRKGYLQTQFGLKSKNGLSDYLSGRLTLAEVTDATPVAGLSVVTRGQIPPNPSELLMHSNFSQFVTEVSALYDLVIIDTPPILAVTDPAIVSAHAGTTLLVTRFGQNHLREIELTRNRFEQNGIDVKGVVFNGVVKKASNAYGYYGYAYESDKK
ncbi:polysaccharide biosynthesis tyrosine autokinase [Colwellia sp. MB02u-18]|uniref:polysaccharide biosynthesis tyrosine autokinase n=1 Tax=unclassified Colwellia TaxID=196834 RepID=UPI0015F637E2|nr:MULTISPECIES: polysaccharide biosynthesis tyrosine autokinase [unclassified Colwellia]MBA6222877.1 polysaccharide biosynthesis tyrosine autokinase [Colwellia sp. MB3u-45]MBA6267816.1 polysaccharide biosynthesis tyrosine autokinase [Colwellia sp. MB3u-43]MBA6322377.1 polysaccharide biosynthesis tyrosine autokinase [Colwellia sp. MB02u-19]MBA6324376.1 polysaccharide biosynthesis tyrosine autokinase [Colwellia sp. MB02u-18]MBA6332532.1 polysaccharide biosynthesis tyrosine autokinase [Colwellia